jgi:hypothetical protein
MCRMRKKYVKDENDTEGSDKTDGLKR